jgi:hypothetical protein
MVISSQFLIALGTRMKKSQGMKILHPPRDVVPRPQGRGFLLPDLAVTGAAPSVSPETAAAGEAPQLEKPSDRLMRLFKELIRVRHRALSHLRTHTVGQTCPRCGTLVLDDRVAQAAYEAAWHELFDDAPPRAAGLGAAIGTGH